MRRDSLKRYDAVILCGGLGTRLRSVLSDRPKALAPFGQRTFLDIVVRQLIEVGVNRFVLSTGHLGEQIKEHIQEYYGESKNLEFVIAQEPESLGTGGGLKYAMQYVKSDAFFVLNGDSLCEVDLREIADFHDDKNALISMALARDVRPDGGGVVIDENNEVINFKEKNRTPTNFMNGGVYVMRRNIIKYMPSQKTFSLEYDVFPALVKRGKFFGFPADGKVYDIGTPERYREALKRFTKIQSPKSK